MQKILAIAGPMLMDRLLSGAMPVPHKSKSGMALLLLSGILGVIGGGFLIAAFYAWVLTQFTPDIAALITAGAVFALAIAVGLTGMNVLHHRKVRRASLADEMKTKLQAAIDTFDNELGDKVRDNPAMSMVIAAIAGYIVADKVL